MLLIGLFDSPFVRRVAISMQLLEVPFEHREWSVRRDFEQIRHYNPLGRVPTLVLEDGQILHESAAILDYLDQLVGPKRALLPASGPERREALRLIAFALGAADKGRDIIYERNFRPAERRHEPWVERCRSQMHGALAELSRSCAERGQAQWMLGERMTQADITAACAFTFVSNAVPIADTATLYPPLAALVARCEALPPFLATYRPSVAPGGGTGTATGTTAAADAAR